MKIKINIRSKSVEVEGKVNRMELGKILKELLPNHKEFRIDEVERFSNWENPIPLDLFEGLNPNVFQYNIEA